MESLDTTILNTAIPTVANALGVAALASLLTGAFVGTRQPEPTQMLLGIHRTLLTLGLITIAASLIFVQLRRNDGAAISRRRVGEADEPVLST